MKIEVVRKMNGTRKTGGDGGSIRKPDVKSLIGLRK